MNGTEERVQKQSHMLSVNSLDKDANGFNRKRNPFQQMVLINWTAKKTSKHQPLPHTVPEIRSKQTVGLNLKCTIKLYKKIC